MNRRFEGRTAVVTGAGSGIGRATAQRLASEGAAVVSFDIDEGRAAETVDSIVGAGGSALAVQGDVRNPDAIERAVAASVERFGAVHHLANVAGTHTRAGLDDLSEEDWDLVVDINLKGPFLFAQAFAPVIAAVGGGSMVNVTSVEAEVVVALRGNCQPHYNASKGGLAMLTKAMAHELGPKGIRVNAVAPGVIRTPLLERALDPAAAEEKLRDRLVIKRLGRPEEIAAAIAFLLSDDASYVTGVQLAVDGGWLVY